MYIIVSTSKSHPAPSSPLSCSLLCNPSRRDRAYNPKELGRWRGRLNLCLDES